VGGCCSGTPELAAIWELLVAAGGRRWLLLVAPLPGGGDGGTPGVAENARSAEAAAAAAHVDVWLWRPSGLPGVPGLPRWRGGPGLGVQGALAGSAGVLGGARFDPCIYTYAGIKRYNKYAYPKSKYSLLAIIGMNMKTFLLHNLLFGHKNNR
jgi:hypothetical protein